MNAIHWLFLLSLSISCFAEQEFYTFNDLNFEWTTAEFDKFLKTSLSEEDYNAPYSAYLFTRLVFNHGKNGSKEDQIERKLLPLAQLVLLEPGNAKFSDDTDLMIKKLYEFKATE